MIGMLERVIPLVPFPSNIVLDSIDENLCKVIMFNGMALVVSAVSCVASIYKKFKRGATKTIDVFSTYLSMFYWFLGAKLWKFRIFQNTWRWSNGISIQIPATIWIRSCFRFFRVRFSRWAFYRDISNSKSLWKRILLKKKSKRSRRRSSLLWNSSPDTIRVDFGRRRWLRWVWVLHTTNFTKFWYFVEVENFKNFQIVY